MYLYIALNFILFVLNKNEIKYHITIKELIEIIHYPKNYISI